MRGIKNNRTTQGNIRSKRLRITHMNNNISLCETRAEQTVPPVSIKDIYRWEFISHTELGAYVQINCLWIHTLL